MCMMFPNLQPILPQWMHEGKTILPLWMRFTYV